MIVGDFNMDIIQDDNVTIEFLNNFTEKEYIPCFLGITRPANDGFGGTCIDNFFFKSNSIAPTAYKLCTNEISDHYSLIVALDIILKQENKKQTSVVNYTKLKNKANLTDWNSILSIQDPNEAVNVLISNVQNCLNSASFCKTTKKRDRDRIPRKRWISPALITSCKKKEMLYKLHKMNPNCPVLKHDYKNYTKILDRVIKDAKFKYER